MDILLVFHGGKGGGKLRHARTARANTRCERGRQPAFTDARTSHKLRPLASGVPFVRRMTQTLRPSSGRESPKPVCFWGCEGGRVAKQLDPTFSPAVTIV